MGPAAKPPQRLISLPSTARGSENPNLCTIVSLTRNSLNESLVVTFRPATNGTAYVERYPASTHLLIAEKSVPIFEWSKFTGVHQLPVSAGVALLKLTCCTPFIAISRSRK